jgi:hypothetical protein
MRYYLIEEMKTLDEMELKSYLQNKYNVHNDIEYKDLLNTCKLLKIKVAEYKEDKPDSIKWKGVRRYRNTILKDTDWIVNSDIVNKEALLAYRQILRDITLYFNNPEEVVYPTMPKIITNKKEKRSYSPEELDHIKSAVSPQTLEEWAKFNFINDIDLIKNLIKLHEIT